MELLVASSHRRPDGGRGLSAAAAPDLPGDPWACASVLCGERLPVRQRPAGHRHVADPVEIRRCQLYRPAAAGAGADRDRDLLRDDGGSGDDRPRRVSRGRQRPDRHRRDREPTRTPHHDALDHRSRRPAGDAGADHRLRHAPRHRAGAGRLGRWHGAAAGRRHRPCRAGRGRHDACLPAGRLARALRHRAGARPAVGADGAADREPGADRADPCHRHRLGRARAGISTRCSSSS